MGKTSKTIKVNGKSISPILFDDIVNTCFGFIYITFHKGSSMKYLGLHYRWEKNYLGSGTYLMNAVGKYGKDRFERVIIDTADSFEELRKLEGFYITEFFGMNLAVNPEWYNITSGLQRGGNTWMGMSSEDKKRRSEKMSKSLKGRELTLEHRTTLSDVMKLRFQDSDNRKLTSVATKKAMQNPELREYLSRVKIGTTPLLSAEVKESQRERGRRVGELSTTPWNKGVPATDELKNRVSESTRSTFLIYRYNTIWFKNVSVRGSYQGLADYITEHAKCKIGKNLVFKLVKSGEVYSGNKPELQGLRIVRVNADVEN